MTRNGSSSSEQARSKPRAARQKQKRGRKLAVAVTPSNAAVESSEEDDLSHIPDIAIAGDLLDQVRVIPHTMTSLVMLVGKYNDGRRVLTPHVELKLASDPEGDEEGDPVPVFTALLTLENASFILADFADDLASIASYMKDMVSDDLPLDKGRMVFILKNLNWAGREVDNFKAAAREILARYDVVEDVEW